MVQVIADYRTTDDRLSAFLQVFLDEITLPIEATLLGMPVEVTELDYFDDGRGLVARCHRPGADQYLTLADLVFVPQSVVAWIHAAYRQWLGMKPFSSHAFWRRDAQQVQALPQGAGGEPAQGDAVGAHGCCG